VRIRGGCLVGIAGSLQGSGVAITGCHRDVAAGPEQPPGCVDPDRKRLELAGPGFDRSQLLIRLVERGEGGRRVGPVERGERRPQPAQGRLGRTPHVAEGIGSTNGVAKLAGRGAHCARIDGQPGCRDAGLQDGQLPGDSPEGTIRPYHQGVASGQRVRGGCEVRAGGAVTGNGQPRANPSLIERGVQDRPEGVEGVGRVGPRGRQHRPGGAGPHGIGEEGIGGALAEQRAKGDDRRETQQQGTSRVSRGTGAGGAYHATVPATGSGSRGGANGGGPANGSVLAAELAPLPKAELHLHLDGGVRPATAVALALEAGMPLDIVEARRRMVAPPHCPDQADLLTYFDLPISLLQTRAALRRTARELVEDLAADRVTYAEIRWAPRLHLDGGLGVAGVMEAVSEGVEEARAALGPAAPLVGLIVTAMRSHPPAANVLLAREAAAFGLPVVGFDLAGPEAAWPAPPHAAAFVTAAENGLALTAHAGEVPGPERIREALALGATRIAHGVTAADDAGLVSELLEREVTLDMCPTSNVQAGIVPALASHPLARLHRAGVSVTCSTDDPVVSDTTLTDELARTAWALGLTRVEVAAVALNAFRRGFLPNAQREPLMAAANDAWAAWAGESTLLS
jgi:adenosine deaminase